MKTKQRIGKVATVGDIAKLFLQELKKEHTTKKAPTTKQK